MRTSGPAGGGKTPAQRTGRAAGRQPIRQARPVRPQPGEIVLVTNPDDSVAVAQHLADLHAPGHGRVVVSPIETFTGPAPTSYGAARRRLGADLLTALGKDPEEIAHHSGQALALAGFWIRGERISDLVVDRAQAVHQQVLRELAEFARDTPLRLWLVWVAAPLRRPDLGKVTVRTITAEQFRAALPATSGRTLEPASDRTPAQASAASQQPAPRDWPALPSSDFPVFMEVCRARLDPADFRRVAETFDLAREAAAELALDLGIHHGESRYHDLQILHVETWLRDQVLAGDHHPSQSLAKLRGIQAGFFERHLYLRWRRSLLPHPPETHLGTRLTADVVARLRSLCSPETAAALVIHLHLAAGLTSITVGQISTDGATYTQDVAYLSRTEPVRHRFPPSAHGILAAYLAHRTSTGAVDDSSPLFPKAPAIPGRELLRQRFGVVRLAAPVPPSGRAHATPWLSERGLSLQRLDTHEIIRRRT
ncbi:hypothetical protein [Actinomadura geliboluensis]|uniref:Uncharacterized protein n=1 Tax=Actinomadura geliboluensis TaxID=882440 RepID=A0A5S4H7D8_9ACTN|nr:hypothetical protein [Actinomadura geliboluensis]TMR40892.1 hypothetical protein ETD96_08410 [Actinomadura geliboluensis]